MCFASRRPRCRARAARSAPGAAYATLHSCWGAQIFRQGEFHTDPHPGNVVLLEDGRVGLLDWGQTKVLPARQGTILGRGARSLHGARRYRGLARTIEVLG